MLRSSEADCLTSLRFAEAQHFYAEWSEIQVVYPLMHLELVHSEHCLKL